MPQGAHDCKHYNNDWKLARNFVWGLDILSNIFRCINHVLPNVNVGFREGFGCFLVVSDGILAILLDPEPIFEAIAQFNEGFRALVSGGLSVVQQRCFRLLGNPIASLVHYSKEVVWIRVILFLGYYLPAVHVDLIQIISRTLVHFTQKHFYILLLALSIAFLGWSFYQSLCFLFILNSYLALKVYDTQIVQRFHILRLCCSLEIIHAFTFVFILWIVVIEWC